MYQGYKMTLKDKFVNFCNFNKIRFPKKKLVGWIVNDMAFICKSSFF